MIKIRVEKTGNYSIISNHILRRKDISARAKGVFCYLMSLPDDWKLFRGELCTHFTEGRDAINATMKELIEKGYLVVAQHKDDEGKFIKSEYTLFDHSPLTENPLTDNQLTENPPLLSTKEPSTNKTNTSYSDSFEKMWEKYPRKVNKRGAFRSWKARKAEGVKEGLLYNSVLNYATSVEGKDEQYIMHGSTFFGRNKRFVDFTKTAPSKYCVCGATFIDGKCLLCGRLKNSE